MGLCCACAGVAALVTIRAHWSSVILTVLSSSMKTLTGIRGRLLGLSLLKGDWGYSEDDWEHKVNRPERTKLLVINPWNSSVVIGDMPGLDIKLLALFPVIHMW